MSIKFLKFTALSIVGWLALTAIATPLGISIAKSWGVSRSTLAGINVAGSIASFFLCICVGIRNVRMAVLLLLTLVPVLNSVSSRFFFIADPFIIQPLTITLWTLFFLSIPAWKRIILRSYDILWLCAIIATFLTSFLVAPDTTNALRATISFGIEPSVAYIVFRCAFNQNQTTPPIRFFAAAVAGMMIIHFCLIGLDLFKIGGIKALFASRAMQQDKGMLWTGGFNEPSQSAAIILLLIFPVIGYIVENPRAKKYKWLIAAMLLILIASLTRSAIVLFLIFSVLFLWYLKRNAIKLPVRIFLPIIMFCFFVMIEITPFILQRAIGTAASTWIQSDKRILNGLPIEYNMLMYLMSITAHIDLFLSHWLGGIGVANLFEYKGHFEKWGLNTDPTQLYGTLIGNIDSLVALGVIGFFLYYGRTLLLFNKLSQSIKKAPADIKPGMIGIAVALLYPLLIWNWSPGARPAYTNAFGFDLMGSNLHAIIGSFLFAYAASYIEYVKSNVLNPGHHAT